MAAHVDPCGEFTHQVSSATARAGIIVGVFTIFHIISEPEWRAACEVGRYAPESLATDGFVHFSHAEQVAATANHLYADRRDLIVLEVDAATLDEDVVEEDLYGMGEDFPHVYAAIPTRCVIAEHRLQRDDSGAFVFGSPTGSSGSSGPISPDRPRR
ncbi:DUF952 domain-containing protein [Jatrophihabitans telluris]|uniref:DUF952 domain-containing protein n=1 Tax=Jatrophihabitans telluris TaxID=2038343 RepID=A0ABY4R1H3_9ACTN|nr:DUF952 domain-containing protein [Jatrophihabitans telluris]UQX89654.1 DUF952 domain-containing protein [Jatrophihabitans telluris]